MLVCDCPANQDTFFLPPQESWHSTGNDHPWANVLQCHANSEVSEFPSAQWQPCYFIWLTRWNFSLGQFAWSIPPSRYIMLADSFHCVFGCVDVCVICVQCIHMVCVFAMCVCNVYETCVWCVWCIFMIYVMCMCDACDMYMWCVWCVCMMCVICIWY